MTCEIRIAMLGKMVNNSSHTIGLYWSQYMWRRLS